MDLRKQYNMKKYIILLTLPIILWGCEGVNLVQIGDAVGGMAAPTSAESSKGLKEALKIGLNKGVENLSVKDGFWGDAAKRILLPPEVLKIEKDLKGLPIVGKEYDRMIQNMNHGAEEAVGLAKDVFIDAVTKMTVQDALGIVTGGKGSATTYLKKATSTSLEAKFQPIIKKSLDKVGVTKNWSSISSAYNMFASKKINTDLNAHVTNKAMEALFIEVEKQENLIRSNPAQRVTAILKKVFGYADTQK
jgi:hypothetical protein